MSDRQFCIPFCVLFSKCWFRKFIIPSRLCFSWLSPHHWLNLSSSFLLCQIYFYHTATSNLSLTFPNHVLLNPFFNLLCSWPFPLTRVQMCNWPVPLLLLCPKFLYGSTWHSLPDQILNWKTSSRPRDRTRSLKKSLVASILPSKVEVCLWTCKWTSSPKFA